MLIDDSKSQLTILMQLADAYLEIGNRAKSKELWRRIKEIDPDCKEAKEKGKADFLSLPEKAIRVMKLLSGKS